MNPRIQAENKAVLTLRLNKLSNIDRKEIEEISREIIHLQYAYDDDMSRESIISKNIGPTTWKSFCRFGNKRNATPGLILYWINNKEMSLDEQAMWMSESYNTEFLPDELAQFMMNYDRGLSYFEPVQKIIEAKKLFKLMAGFNFNPSFAKKYLIPQVNHSDNPF